MTTKTRRAKTPPASPEQALLDALRRNLHVLGELAVRYDIETKPERFAGELPAVHSPEDVRRLLQSEMAGLAQEQFRVLLLDRKNRVVGQRVIYQGNVSAVAAIRTAEVLRPAVVEAVPGVIVAHNHPSGDPEPSPEDVAVTKALVEAGKLLDIEVLDHVVIGCPGIVSLKERGLLPA